MILIVLLYFVNYDQFTWQCLKFCIVFEDFNFSVWYLAQDCINLNPLSNVAQFIEQGIHFKKYYIITRSTVMYNNLYLTWYICGDFNDFALFRLTWPIVYIRNTTATFCVSFFQDFNNPVHFVWIIHGSLILCQLQSIFEWFSSPRSSTQRCISTKTQKQLNQITFLASENQVPVGGKYVKSLTLISPPTSTWFSLVKTLS